MNWLEFSNLGGFWWVLLALPIVAFYILKIRVRRRPVSTLLFWDKLFEEKKPRAWWQNLRHLLSLLLQLAFLILLVIALTDPLWSWQKEQQKTTILVIDNSASMSVQDAGGQARLDQAKTAARGLIRSMRQGDQMAIITAGGQPKVALGFTDHQNSLLETIDNLPLTDGPTAIQPSIETATRLANSSTGQQETIVITDGCSSDLEQYLEQEKVRLYGVGQPTDNLGITRFQIRRSPVDPIGYQALIDVTNYSKETQKTRVEFTLGEDLVDVIPLELEPGQTMSRVVDYTSRAGGQFTAELNTEDGLMADNQAVAVLPELAPIRILMISTGNVFLQSVLESVPLVQLEIKDSVPEPLGNWDVLVFDGNLPENPPPGKTIVLRPQSSSSLWELGDVLSDPIVARVNDSSPVTQHVKLDNVQFPEAKKMEPKGEVDLLVVDPLEQPLVARFVRPQGDIVVLNCGLDKGDLPLRIAFPVLMKNTIEWFQGAQRDMVPSLKVGETLSVNVSELLKRARQAKRHAAATVAAETDSAGTDLTSEDTPNAVDEMVVQSASDSQDIQLELVSPSDKAFPVSYIGDQVTVGPLQEQGVWRIRQKAETPAPDQEVGRTTDHQLMVSCNLVEPMESNLTPPIPLPALDDWPLLVLGGRSLWFYLTCLALGLITTEWWLYQRRIVG